MSNARNLARLLPNAAGQIPSANLQDSSIISSKIASQAILPANMTASAIVGFVKYEDHPSNDNYTLIAADTDYQTAVSITYAPKFSNSLILIHAEHQVRIINALGGTLGIKRDGSYVNGSNLRSSLAFVYKGDSVNHHYQLACETVVPANNTASTTFTLWFTPYGGTGEVNNGWGNRIMWLMEIKQ
jgi:hypothetical protein